jgi:hypothetical protein
MQSIQSAGVSLQSPELAPPPPYPLASVALPPPPFGSWGGYTRWGVSIIPLRFKGSYTVQYSQTSRNLKFKVRQIASQGIKRKR